MRIVLVGIDGSEGSQRALKFDVGWAQDAGATPTHDDWSQHLHW